MDIIIAIHNVWTDKIFAGTKPFEFRTKLPAEFQVGDKIYRKRRKTPRFSHEDIRRTLRWVGNCVYHLSAMSCFSIFLDKEVL